MTKDVQLGWIAKAEARRVAESALTQHGVAEPRIGVVPAPAAAPRHWVRRLVARFVPPPGEGDDRGSAGRSG